VAEEAEGLRLHLSSSNSNGYKGVHKDASGRFYAQHRVDGSLVSIGHFGTAVEAAVVYARAVGEYQPPAHPPPTVATEAEGLRLHLSSSNVTGYNNVCKHPTGRFQAQRKVDGGRVSLGLFGTAVKAAVAYARAVGEAPEAGSAVAAAAGQAAPLTLGEAAEGAAAAEPVVEEAAGAAPAAGAEEPAPLEEGAAAAAAAAEAPLAEEAKGLRLHLSSSSSTGYKGVYSRDGRFHAQHSVGGRKVTIGRFDTAVEAAVAYARSVGEAPEAGSPAGHASAALPGEAAAGAGEEAVVAEEGMVAAAVAAGAESAGPVRRSKRSLAQAGMNGAAS